MRELTTEQRETLPNLAELNPVVRELSREQRERAEAVGEARRLLEGFSEVSTVDLVCVAFWIVTGLDPYDRRLERTEPPDAANWSPDPEVTA